MDAAFMFCRILSLVVALVVTAAAVQAQVYGPLNEEIDNRGKPELVVCTQNLQNYGCVNCRSREVGGKEVALVKRFLSAGCDVIAVQELLGKTEEEAKQNLMFLGRALAARSGRSYEAVVGESNDSRIRQGYLVALDRAEVVNKVSYAKAELPKIAENQKQRFFSRGPLELQVRVLAFDDSQPKLVTLVNFHFKSQSTKGGSDPSGLQFEPYRMEMAEALRRIVSARHKQSLGSGETVLVLLGDRNSHFDTASARIMEGALFLSDFQGTAACRLSKRGLPLCLGGTARRQRYFSVLTGDPQAKRLPGTIRYGDVFSWFDDIVLPAESLPFAWQHYAKAGDYSSGVIYEPKTASDHALVWLRLNW